MIVIEIGKPIKGNIISFWKNMFKHKITWAIIFIFIKFTYVGCSLYEYANEIEKKHTSWIRQ